MTLLYMTSWPYIMWFNIGGYDLTLRLTGDNMSTWRHHTTPWRHHSSSPLRHHTTPWRHITSPWRHHTLSWLHCTSSWCYLFATMTSSATLLCSKIWCNYFFAHFLNLTISKSIFIGNLHDFVEKNHMIKLYFVITLYQNCTSKYYNFLFLYLPFFCL